MRCSAFLVLPESMKTQYKCGQCRKCGTVKWSPRTGYRIGLDEKQSSDIYKAVTPLICKQDRIQS